MRRFRIVSKKGTIVNLYSHTLLGCFSTSRTRLAPPGYLIVIRDMLALNITKSYLHFAVPNCNISYMLHFSKKEY